MFVHSTLMLMYCEQTWIYGCNLLVIYAAWNVKSELVDLMLTKINSIIYILL